MMYQRDSGKSLHISGPGAEMRSNGLETLQMINAEYGNVRRCPGGPESGWQTTVF